MTQQRHLLTRALGMRPLPAGGAAAPVDRQSARDQAAARSTLAGLIARGISLGVGFVTVPLTIGYLGIERYGVLVTISSIAAMLVFADLGLGNGLLNIVSDANGRDDRDAAATAISSAAGLLGAIAIALCAVFVIAIPLVNWSGFLHLDAGAAPEAGATAAVVLFALALGLPLGIVDKTRLGYQEAMANSMAAVAGALLSLVALLVAIAAHASLPILVLAITVMPMTAMALNGYELFRVRRRWAMPRLGRMSRPMAVRLAKVGTMFFVLQVAIAVAYQSDIVVAAALFGTEAAATYSVTLKLAMLVPTLVAIYLMVLWPAYGEALARGDMSWTRRTLRRSVMIALAASAASGLGLVILGPWAIEVWTRGAVHPPFMLLVGAALWSVTSATFNAIAMLLNAANVVAFQSIAASVMAVASISASILFGHLFGLSGIVWGTLIAYVVCSAVPVCVYLPRLMRNLEAQAAGSTTGATL
jgi:O-antigen/teichoic acid export membrane protein